MSAVLDRSAYEWTAPVTGFEVDMFNRMKISALMKRQQEIGEKHLLEFGSSAESMRDKQGVAYVFTKAEMVIHSLPAAKDVVTLTTWCSALKGVRFTRNFVLRDETGNALTECKIEVTTIDLKTRKIVRPKSIAGFEEFLYNDEIEISCPYPQKLQFDGDFVDAQTRIARFSDIDVNGHINNTVYADIVQDCLTKEQLAQPITGFAINYNNEAYLGETLEIAKAETDNGFLFAGRTQNHNCFTARLTFG